MYQFSGMTSERKPPLPKSPMRLRSRRPLQPSNSTTTTTTTTTAFQTPVSLGKYHIPKTGEQDSELRPEYRTISCELRALTKMVWNELGNAEPKNNADAAATASYCGLKSGVEFERGRLYDEYSARRNERLKRKKGLAAPAEHEGGKPTPAHAVGLGVKMESAKKYSSRKSGSVRKSISAAYSAMEVSETPRYLLRSMSKENKKPPLAAKYAAVGAEKMGTRRVVRI